MILVMSVPSERDSFQLPVTSAKKQVDVVLLLKPGTMQLANSSIDSICYYELTNYVLLLYNRVILGCAITLLANSRIL